LKIKIVLHLTITGVNMEVERIDRSQAVVYVVKDMDTVKYLLERGIVDFNVDCLHWTGPPPLEPIHVVQIASWGNAAVYSDVGYFVSANSIDELGGYLSWLVEYSRANNIPIIYCRVSVPGYEYRTSYADMYLNQIVVKGAD